MKKNTTIYGVMSFFRRVRAWSCLRELYTQCGEFIKENRLDEEAKGYGSCVLVMAALERIKLKSDAESQVQVDGVKRMIETLFAPLPCGGVSKDKIDQIKKLVPPEKQAEKVAKILRKLYRYVKEEDQFWGLCGLRGQVAK